MTRPEGSAPLKSASSRLDEVLIEAVFSAGAHNGAVYVLSENCHVLQMETAIGLPAAFARTWAKVRTNDSMPIAAAVRDRRLVWFSDRVALAREFPATALSLPSRFAVAASPVCADGVVVGAFVLGWPSAGQTGLTQRQIHVIDDACDKIGRLLHQARSQGRPVGPSPMPRFLDPLRAHLSSGPDAGPTALRSLDSLPEGYCHLDEHGRVTLITPVASELVAAAPSETVGKRLCEALPWLNDPMYEERYHDAILGDQATQFTVRHPDGRRLQFECFPSLPGITIRITAISAAEAAVEDVAENTDRDHRVVGLHDVVYLAVALARATTAQDVVDLVADHVMPVCEAQAMAMLTWDNGRMRVVASRGYTAEGLRKFNGRPVPPEMRWAHGYEEGRPRFYPTWEEFLRSYPDAIRIDDMGAWVLLPLVALGESIGTCVLAYDRPHEFNDRERTMFTALGGLITQAFERAWLYDNEHRLAESLQSRQLPQDLPDFPGLDVAARYVPATPGMDIGGDFYDLIRLSDTMVGAVIGDVQGHDVTAAALMGQVRTAIRAHATAGADPGEVLAHTNRLLTELAPDRFTSCLYVSFDLRRRVASLASAGHLPPVLGLLGAPAEIIDTWPGLLLGIDPDAEYVTTDVNVPPGAVMALYTDGLIEQPGHDLGDAIAALAARFAPGRHQSLNELAESLIKPAIEGRRLDDTALLLLRSTNPPP